MKKTIKALAIMIVAFFAATGLATFLRDAVYAEYYYNSISVDTFANILSWATFVFWIIFDYLFWKFSK
jgi:hypothetical protein